MIEISSHFCLSVFLFYIKKRIPADRFRIRDSNAAPKHGILFPGIFSIYSARKRKTKAESRPSSPTLSEGTWCTKLFVDARELCLCKSLIPCRVWISPSIRPDMIKHRMPLFQFPSSGGSCLITFLFPLRVPGIRGPVLITAPKTSLLYHSITLRYPPHFSHPLIPKSPTPYLLQNQGKIHSHPQVLILSASALMVNHCNISNYAD